MKKTILSIALLVIALSSDAQWSTSGPNPSGATALAVNGSSIYTGINLHSAAYSTDNATSWNNCTIIMNPAPFVEGIALNGSTIFITDRDLGTVWTSSNNGTTWTQAGNGIGSSDTWELCAMGSTIFVGTGDGVYKTTNNGTLWTAANTGIATNTVIKYFSINGTDIYALGDDPANDFGKIYKSTNSGGSWTAFNFNFQYSQPNSLVVLGSKIFVGSYNGIYSSSDGGSSWSLITNGLPANTTFITKIGTALFAGTDNSGVYRSYDNGTSWTSVSAGLPASTGVTHLVSNSTYLFGIGNGGVWKRPLSEITAVEEVKGNSSFSIYPNPGNNGVFSISNPGNKLVGIEVYNMLGAKVFTSPISSGKTVIDLSNQAKGVYTYSIKTKEGKIETGKLVVE